MTIACISSRPGPRGSARCLFRTVSAIHFKDTLPPDFAPVLVCDASGALPSHTNFGETIAAICKNSTRRPSLTAICAFAIGTGAGKAQHRKPKAIAELARGVAIAAKSILGGAGPYSSRSIRGLPSLIDVLVQVGRVGKAALGYLSLGW